MAVAPVTWRNVSAPTFSSSANTLNQAGQSISRGLSAIGDSAAMVQSNLQEQEQAAVKADTDKILAGLATIKDKAGYDAAMEAGAFTPETVRSVAPNADVGAITAALQQKDAEIFDRSLQTAQNQRAEEATRANIQNTESAIAARDAGQVRTANADQFSAYVNAGEYDRARELIQSSPAGLPANAGELVNQAQGQAGLREVDAIFKDLSSTQKERRTAVQGALDTQEYSDDPRNLFKVRDDGSVSFTDKATPEDKRTASTLLTDSILSTGFGEVTDKAILDRLDKQLSANPYISSTQAGSLIAGYKGLLDANEGLTPTQQAAYTEGEQLIAQEEDAQIGSERLTHEADLAKFPVSEVATLKENTATLTEVNAQLSSTFQERLGFDPGSTEEGRFMGSILAAKRKAFKGDVKINSAGELRSESFNSVPDWALAAAGSELINSETQGWWDFNYTNGEAENLGARIVERAQELTIMDRQEAFNAEIRNEITKEYNNKVMELSKTYLNKRKELKNNLTATR